MVREDWRPIFASLLFVVVISVNGRPSDLSYENDLSDKSGVQMSANNDDQSTSATSPSAFSSNVSIHRQVESSSPSLTNLTSSRRMLPVSAPQPSLRHDLENTSVPMQSQKRILASNQRTAGRVIVTSHNGETVTDLQCKSESKPIYFKSILNRLRAPKRPEIELVRKPPPRQMECHSESKVLNLRTKNRTPSTAELASWLVPPPHQPSHHLSRRENARHLSASKARRPHSRTAIEQWRDMVREHYQHHLPGQLLNPYLAAERATTISPPSSPSGAYLFFKTPSPDYQQPQSTTIVSTIAPAQVPLSHANQTANNFLIEVSEVKSVARSEIPVTRIILKPLARAKAGQGGVAISSPLSTAYIKRGDYVEIEYLPEATADVGEGGVALSRPELVIHFVDRRRR